MADINFYEYTRIAIKENLAPVTSLKETPAPIPTDAQRAKIAVLGDFSNTYWSFLQKKAPFSAVLAAAVDARNKGITNEELDKAIPSTLYTNKGAQSLPKPTTLALESVQPLVESEQIAVNKMSQMLRTWQKEFGANRYLEGAISLALNGYNQGETAQPDSIYTELEQYLNNDGLGDKPKTVSPAMQVYFRQAITIAYYYHNLLLKLNRGYESNIKNDAGDITKAEPVIS